MPDFKRYSTAIAVNTTFIGDLGLQQSPPEVRWVTAMQNEAGRYLNDVLQIALSL